MGDESKDPEEPRGERGYEYVGAIILWLCGTALGEATVIALFDGPEGFADWLDEIADCVEAFVFKSDGRVLYLLALMLTSPFLLHAFQVFGRPPPMSIEARLDDLVGFSPGLRRLIADARALRVALEQRDEATLREVWDWQRRFEQLDEADRRELELLGIGDPGIAEWLRWMLTSRDRSGRLERGMREIIGALEGFERRLLEANSLFRGPFR